ncbi:hypothetical protein [Streptomyces boninensis]|uniref:hypothetical protein n=1 Tax=Streptomyces boninensis TaxID=2039455 RepID=UPI003B2118D5
MTVRDDALHVLTALLLTPAQFPAALGDDYPEACTALGLPPAAEGYGLVLGQDGEGARWTVAVADVSGVAGAIAAWDCGMEAELTPSGEVASLPGWPLELAVSAPDVPEPHDPPEEAYEEGLPVLAPPSGDEWGAAQRRLVADEIALQWRAWREQLEEGEPAADEPAGESAADERADESAADEPADDSAPDGATELNSRTRRVIDALHAYVTDPPPPGRIRSSYATEDARTLRVDGPGWSVVARTDDLAFMLLDDEPGEIFPVRPGPSLPGLLADLDAIAARPA